MRGLKRELKERAQRELRRSNQAARQASKQERKLASTWSAFSRSHALEGLVWVRNGGYTPKEKIYSFWVPKYFQKGCNKCNIFYFNFLLLHKLAFEQNIYSLTLELNYYILAISEIVESR